MSDITEIEIEILAWDKFNPKRDQKSYSWLRLDNDIASNPSLFGLDAELKWVWVVLLCQASKKNSGKVSLSVEFLAHLSGVKPLRVTQLIETLVARGLCRVHDNARSRGVADITKHDTYERTNETYERDVRTNDIVAPKVADLEKLYEKYPLKKGKEAGMRKLKAVVKTQADFDEVAKAIENYKADLKKNGTEARFIKHFSTFMTSWRDWLDPDTGTAENFGSAGGIAPIDYSKVFGGAA